MKLKEVLDYLNRGDIVKVVISDGEVDYITYLDCFHMSTFVTETLILSVEVDDDVLCIRTYVPYNHHIALMPDEKEGEVIEIND